MSIPQSYQWAYNGRVWNVSSLLPQLNQWLQKLAIELVASNPDFDQFVSTLLQVPTTSDAVDIGYWFPLITEAHDHVGALGLDHDFLKVIQNLLNEHSDESEISSLSDVGIADLKFAYTRYFNVYRGQHDPSASVLFVRNILESLLVHLWISSGEVQELSGDRPIRIQAGPSKIELALTAIRTSQGIRLDFLAESLSVSIRDLRKMLYQYFDISPPSKAELRQAIRDEYFNHKNAHNFISNNSHEGVLTDSRGDLLPSAFPTMPQEKSVTGRSVQQTVSDENRSSKVAALSKQEIQKRKSDATNGQKRLGMIIEMRLEGSTLAEIGKKFSISPERVRQVLVATRSADDLYLKAELNISKKITALKDALNSDEFSFPLTITMAESLKLISSEKPALENLYELDTCRTMLGRQLQRFLRENPGIFETELKDQTGISVELVQGLVPPDSLRFVLRDTETSKAQSRAISDQEILDSVKHAATYQWPLSSIKYDELINFGEISGVKSQRVAQIFGSWSRACELAGVEHLDAFRSAYDQKWTDRELEGFVVEYYSRNSSKGTWEDFNDWLKDDDSRPSGGTVRTRLGAGSWLKVQRRVLRSTQMKEALNEF